MLEILCTDICYLECIDCVLGMLQHVYGRHFCRFGQCVSNVCRFCGFPQGQKMVFTKGKNDVLAYVFLAMLWSHGSFFYFDAEISFPWLVLGNGFATNVSLIQWYEATGVLGGSLWVWIVNLGFFSFSEKILPNEKSYCWQSLFLLP